MAGMYSLHQIGIIFANLCPKKVMEFIFYRPVEQYNAI